MVAVFYFSITSTWSSVPYSDIYVIVSLTVFGEGNALSHPMSSTQKLTESLNSTDLWLRMGISISNGPLVAEAISIPVASKVISPF